MFSKNNNNQDNPFTKIEVTYKINCDIEKGLSFNFHFQIPQSQPEVLGAANQLLNFLLPAVGDNGFFSYNAIRQKFPNDVGVQRCYNRKYYYAYNRPFLVSNELQGSGTATIYIELPRNESWNDGHYAFLFTLSLIDDAINCMKRLGCIINFSLLEVMNALDKLYTQSKDLYATPKWPEHSDTNPETLRLLLKLIKDNPTLEPQDAIFVGYCLESIACFDIVRQKGNRIEYPILDGINDILKILDDCAHGMVISKTIAKDYWLTPYVNEFLIRLEQCRRIKLFSKILGEIREDGEIYSWFSPEWAFIRDTTFKEVSPEQMVIYPGKRKQDFCGPPLEDSDSRETMSGFMKYYSKDKPFHSEFLNQSSCVRPIDLAIASWW